MATFYCPDHTDILVWGDPPGKCPACGKFLRHRDPDDDDDDEEEEEEEDEEEEEAFFQRLREAFSRWRKKQARKKREISTPQPPARS